MAGDAARVADMRGGAHRAFALALLASILLHALLLATLPPWRAPADVPAPQPLTARLAEPPAPPAPPASAPVEEARPPPSPAAPRPRRPAPQPQPAPAAPAVQPTVSAPVTPPVVPLAPAAPGPVARIEPQPAAPAADSDALESYRASVNAAATRFKRYPRAAIDNNWEGEVVVLLSIDAEGRIAALRVRRSSGYEILDRQALEMFRNAKPFVPLPRALRGREFEVELRAIYSLKDQGSG